MSNDNDLIGEFDAMKWAERFVKRNTANPKIGTDEGTMLAWFSGAIMAGYDWARRKPAPSPSDWQNAIVDDTPCFVSGCDYDDIDVRGPIVLRDDSAHYYACTEHWEAIVGILGRQVGSDDEPQEADRRRSRSGSSRVMTSVFPPPQTQTRMT